MPTSTHQSQSPFPVYFICRRPAKWSDLLGDTSALPPHPDQIFSRIVDNEDCWTVQTYLMLRHAGLDVRLSTHFVPGSVCVVNGLDFGIRNRSWDSFVVACRSDGFDPVLADVSVVQNERQVRSSRDHYIPHWPQPGLIPRSPARAARVENVVFKGDVNNLYAPFRSTAFRQALEGLGMRLQIDGKDSTTQASWNDYGQADVVLAVRDLGIREALAKPASKLVNAWLAGVPAILGPEPAFRDLRTTSLDYVEVTDPRQALDRLAELASEPMVYRDMVSNGHRRAQSFTASALTSRWQTLLVDEVAPRFAGWSRQGRLTRVARFGRRAALHHRSMARVPRDQADRERILG